MDAVIASAVGPPSLKLMLLMLANHLNKDTGRCDPGVDRLAKQVGVSRSQALRLISELRAAGLVAVVNRGGQQTSHYTLHYERIAAYSGRTDATPRGRTHATPDSDAKGGRGGVDASRGRTGAVDRSRGSDPRGRTSALTDVAPVQPKPEAQPEVEPEAQPEGGNLPSLRDGRAAAQRGDMSIQQFVQSFRQTTGSDQLFAEDDPLITEGLTRKQLELAWWQFVRSAIYQQTRSADWLGWFRQSVREDGLGLWANQSGGVRLTPKGERCLAEFREARRTSDEADRIAGA